jgi:predicted amidohydrolase
MPRTIKIALCQLTSAPTIEEGFKKVDDAIAEVSAQGANLAIFPEYFIQGIVADSPHKIFDEGQWEDHVSNLAKSNNMDICIGTFVEKVQVRGAEEKTFNTAYYFNKSGEAVGKYRKRNLWHPEKDYLHPGQDDHLVFNGSFCKVGMLACWDLAWPEAFRALFVQDVELVVIPSYWVADDIEDVGRLHDPEAKNEMSWLDSLVITRAYENECVVAYVNCGGPKDKGFLGCSAVAAPFKGCIGRCAGPDEEIKVVEIDLDVLKDARGVYQ